MTAPTLADLARRAVKRAINSGALKRGVVCECCSASNRALVAHHHLGYDEAHWLDVQWLCRACHNLVHCIPSTLAAYTLDERREFRTRGLRAMTPEQVHAAAVTGGLAAGVNGGNLGRVWEALTAKERSERARALRFRSAPERRVEIARKGWETRRERMAAGVTYRKSGPKPRLKEVMPA